MTYKKKISVIVLSFAFSLNEKKHSTYVLLKLTYNLLVVPIIKR